MSSRRSPRRSSCDRTAPTTARTGLQWAAVLPRKADSSFAFVALTLSPSSSKLVAETRGESTFCYSHTSCRRRKTNDASKNRNDLLPRSYHVFCEVSVKKGRQ